MLSSHRVAGVVLFCLDVKELRGPLAVVCSTSGAARIVPDQTGGLPRCAISFGTFVTDPSSNSPCFFTDGSRRILSAEVLACACVPLRLFSARSKILFCLVPILFCAATCLAPELIELVSTSLHCGVCEGNSRTN